MGLLAIKNFVSNLTSLRAMVEYTMPKRKLFYSTIFPILQNLIISILPTLCTQLVTIIILLFFGVGEYEAASVIANANGGSKFIVSYSALTFFEASEQASLAGTYLARIETAEQQQWLLDEMQCVDINLWIGYQMDPVLANYVKAAGPAQGQVVVDNNGNCITDLLCNEEKKRSINYFPGLASPNALVLSSVSDAWFPVDAFQTARYIVQAEYCSFNAQNFFVNSFAENPQSDSRVCVPNPTNDWSSSRNILDGNHGYFNDKSFYAGAGVYFHNDQNGATRLLYFDCDCNTDPIINKACLGSDAFPGCVLYTNDDEYYYYGIYIYRLYYGLAFSFKRYYEYLYWYFLYYDAQVF